MLHPFPSDTHLILIPTRAPPNQKRPAIDAPLLAAARDFAETFAPVNPVIVHAMSWAAEFGATPVEPGAGAALRLLAATARAKSVVEIGTGIGVSGLWLLEGMRPDGLLTSIDVDADHQAMARQTFAAAGFAASRARLIAGAATNVLPRLADNAYDLVFIDADVDVYASCVSAAHRLLRDGGLLVLNNALGFDGSVVDPAAGDIDTVILRELVDYLREAQEWTPALLSAGTGLLCALKR